MHSDMTGGQGRLRRDFNSDIERAKSEAWCTAQWDDAFLQGASNNIFGNAFYHNEGNGRWTEVSDAAGIENYWPWGVSIGDLNADGYEDVLITSGMGYPFAYGVNSLLLNDRGERFRSAEFLLGIEPRREQRVSKPCFTLDCDGADRNHPLCRGRTGSLQVYSSLSTRSAIIADFDDDGDLDIVTNEFDDAPQVLWSNLSDLRPPRYLKVRLVGTRSNRDGLGATVTMNAGGASQVRYHTGKSGYLAQSRLPLYFGLDQETRVESVEVRWPSGRRQLITDAIPTQGLLVITEPGESPPPTGR
jgi:hypothetical protein